MGRDQKKLSCYVHVWYTKKICKTIITGPPTESMKALKEAALSKHLLVWTKNVFFYFLTRVIAFNSVYAIF